MPAVALSRACTRVVESGPDGPVIAAIKDAGYLHVPEGRRDHTTLAEALHLHGLD